MVLTARDMLTSLLRPKPALHRADSDLRAPSPGPASRQYPEPTADFTEGDEDEDDEDEDEDEGDNENENENENENGFGPDQPSIRFVDQAPLRRNHSPIIPLFSASHLDTLPVYYVVHAIRIIVQTRTETSLSWEQLRSPQVSQFLVKPLQQQIRTQHFSPATLFALMANCLQFGKEGQFYPGNAGVSTTRAKVCELLALKLLKEYSTRELIDVLSYDFDPLQGSPHAPPTLKGGSSMTMGDSAFARSSTLEVAIRASAKHFISHPLVVQQLEAIWSGAITFYSSHDNLHRIQTGAGSSVRSDQNGGVNARTPLLGRKFLKEQSSQLPLHAVSVRRTVALYDPCNASLFKLSRLRVPRYRYFLSTCSLFVMICLFLAVLVQHSNLITSLELLFWFWSAGFMLDEVVGFNEQGFSLYIMSYWNIIDLGILLLLIIYYGMRLCGVFLVDSGNEMAYEVLAANAILLLPRIFSILDHYPYFSQLLIAFRFMAEDLMALFVVILITCSGFFVFFTLSKNNGDAIDVAYEFFQILMGFTPAAWDAWPKYTFLGRLLLIFFLIICHFLITTILITVLSNSFMAIASNAKEEHQFLFAINTISMVKNDSLFSYVAPANIIGWALSPLRYIIPMRQFVLLNRTVIKLTHWPILFLIFIYEKYYLASSIFEPTDLVEGSRRRKNRAFSLGNLTSRASFFSSNVRTREESIAGFQQDQALDEVFRRQPDANTIRTQRRQERRKTQTAIRNWMDQSDEIGEHLSRWPTIESRLSHSRRLSTSRDLPRRFRTLSDVRSAASDPADLMSNKGFPSPRADGLNTQSTEHQSKDLTDADGDDELVTNDEDDDDEIAGESRGENPSDADQEESYFTTPMGSGRGSVIHSSVDSPNHNTAVMSPRTSGYVRRQRFHNRTLSTNTILYNPEQNLQEANQHAPSPSSAPEPIGSRSRPKTSRLITTVEQSAPTGTRSPRRPIQQVTENVTRPRPIPKSTLNQAALLTIEQSRQQRKLSSSPTSHTTGLLADIKNELGAVPASFATQMAIATGQLREHENADRMGRLMLARMKTLEESFADVVREVQLMRSAVPTAQNSAQNSPGGGSWRDSDAELTETDVNLTTQAAKKTSGQRKSRPTSGSGEKLGVGSAVPQQAQKTKGKGKEITRHGESTGENQPTRKVSGKGSSL
ncbi:hypothetical protein F4861DRAFT_548505 [Xylaria intraflava]|nr:hypothetical protein F4861DRAFT_548505 [Xylaria intraflava]